VIAGGSGIILLTAPAAAGRSTSALEPPNRQEIAVGPAVIPDAPLPAGRRFAAAADAPPPGFWGGTYTTSTGEQVTVYASDRYTVDQSLTQKWANFLGSLVHGSELSSVQLLLAPLSQVEQICGTADVLGCYGENTIVASPDDTSGISAEAVITHEYGHHVAENRQNPPWQTVDYGTKRWASYEQVCKKTQAGELFPGSESPPDYELNPGEAFAETYRVLNERELGLPEAPWEIVDQSLYPDATALALLKQDVLQPWTSNRTTTLRGVFLRKGRSAKSFRVTAAYDGTLTASVRGATGMRLTLNLHQTTVCGNRTFTLRVKRTRGAGPFTLMVSRP